MFFVATDEILIISNSSVTIPSAQFECHCLNLSKISPVWRYSLNIIVKDTVRWTIKANTKARITWLFISKTTIMVNKRETVYFVICISDKRLSSFLIFLILSFFFYLYLLFFCTFFVLVLSYCIWTESTERAHSFLTTYLGGTFSLLDISERNIFPGWGCTCTQCTPLRTRLYATPLE